MIQQTNTFTTYELTEAELIRGNILTVEQEAVLRNKLALVAESKLSLQFDGTNPLKFAQAEAYERGQMDVIKWLLDSADAAKLSIQDILNQDSQ
jgi:hypothetical protein